MKYKLKVLFYKSFKYILMVWLIFILSMITVRCFGNVMNNKYVDQHSSIMFRSDGITIITSGDIVTFGIWVYESKYVIDVIVYDDVKLRIVEKDNQLIVEGINIKKKIKYNKYLVLNLVKEG